MGMTPNGLSCWQPETAGKIFLEMTIGECLDQRAEEFPAKEATVYSCYPEFSGALDIRWTYPAYPYQANAVAKGLLTLGLKRGERFVQFGIPPEQRHAVRFLVERGVSHPGPKR